MNNYGATPYWEVPMLDAVQMRHRTLVVRATDGEVVVIPTLGAGLIVPRPSDPVLHDALHTARSVANHQRKHRGSS